MDKRRLCSALLLTSMMLDDSINSSQACEVRVFAFGADDDRKVDEAFVAVLAVETRLWFVIQPVAADVFWFACSCRAKRSSRRKSSFAAFFRALRSASKNRVTLWSAFWSTARSSASKPGVFSLFCSSASKAFMASSRFSACSSRSTAKSSATIQLVSARWRTSSVDVSGLFCSEGAQPMEKLCDAASFSDASCLAFSAT
mmetsp:Transcript_37750/g.88289  ORF Transcript_37750/g.88289 Transcript_37750/m.88289 type:complete len:200 (-) Transcript_37750:1267-1866(-)